MTPSTAPTTPTFMRIALPGSPHFGRSGVVLPPRGDVDRGWAEPDADGMVKVMFENLETVSVPPNCLQPVRSVSEAVTTVSATEKRKTDVSITLWSGAIALTCGSTDRSSAMDSPPASKTLTAFTKHGGV